MAYRQASAFVNQFLDTNGRPLSGGTLKSYLAGTTTTTAMFTDASGTSAGSTITLNARGEPEVSSNTITIWLDEAINYKFVLADSAGTTIWTVDNINVGIASAALDILGAAPLINFKTSAGESFDTRIAQIANGLAFYTGGNGATVLGMLLDQNRNLLLDPAGAGGSPTAPLHVKGATADYPIKVESTDSKAGVQMADNATTGLVGVAALGDNLLLEALNILAGTTSTTLYSSGAGGATGLLLAPSGPTSITRSEAITAYFNRINTEGDILALRRNGSTVGTLGTVGSDLYIVNGDTGLRFNDDVDSIYPVQASGLGRDNAIDLGFSSLRWDDIYATNGTIQTSDRNEKQDIEELSDAEQRVAVAAKALLRKFRWKDKVVEKGDKARIHFGIIAQDLQAAFEAEGLDASKYAMFIKSEWWQAEVTRPAAPAVTDEDGNIIEEAIPELTYTEHFNTKAEAPRGAVKKCRLGVRYSELLAFIIAAI